MRLNAILFAAILTATAAPRAAEIVIGTGSSTGVYFPVGHGICQIAERNVEGLVCEALDTAGSVSNVTDVLAGAMQIGLVQSDIHYHAVNRSGPFQSSGSDGSDLRALFSLHTEPFTLVTRRDSGIRVLDDLKGRRVNIGNPGSGQRATMEVVMAAKGWSRADFQLVTELPASQQSLYLCHDRIQAMVYTVGHPNPSVARAVRQCKADIVAVMDGAIDKLVTENPYYSRAVIAAGIYDGIDRPVETFGVLATVVTSASVDEELVYRLVRAVFENFDQFRSRHPVLRDLTPERMIRDGLAAPLHAGAERYYRERGWL